MGEATYYGKIVFETPEDAEAAFNSFKDLCIEVYRAGEWWQENRDLDDRLIFWSLFNSKFPRATDYLKHAGLFEGDHNNALAGQLDVLGIESDADEILLCPWAQNQIRWSSTVWHFADWDPFLRYVKSIFKGVERVGYVSDEYTVTDLFDMI